MSRRRALLATMLAAVAIGGTDGASGAPHTVSASFPVADRFDPTPRPLGAVTVIGDSVLYGSVVFSPHVGEQLAARGWGPVRVRGGGSYTTGYFPVGNATRASHWIDLWQQQGWDAPNVIVNLGTNDSGLCGIDLSCARAAIRHVLDAIGPGKRVWWPQITRSPRDQRLADTWNLALRQLADERPDLFTWDWPAVMQAEGLRSGDNIHLDPDGYRRRSVLIADTFTAAVAQATRVGGDASLPAVGEEPSVFVPIGPIRVADTRIDHRRIDAGETASFDLSDAVPAGTTAVAVYAAAIGADDRGYLTVFGCDGDRPAVSSVNYPAASVRGAMTISPLGADGALCVASRSSADVVLDLQGAFVPTGDSVAGDGLRLDPLPQPERLVDTRADDPGDAADSTITIDVGPDTAAVAVSITAVGGDAPGFVTAFACDDELPTVATVNHGAREIVAGAGFVPVSDDGRLCVYRRSDADVTVDLTGTFSSSGALVFQPVPPTRTVDTRDATGGWSPVHGTGQTIDTGVAPAEARAVSGALTLVEPAADGHIRAWSCGDLPDTANVNAPAGAIRTNAVTTGVDDGRLCLFARSRATTVFDTTGWWVPAT